jgi:hypothetical protein
VLCVPVGGICFPFYQELCEVAPYALMSLVEALFRPYVDTVVAAILLPILGGMPKLLNYFLASVETLFLLPILVVSSKCCVLQLWEGEVNMVMRGCTL